MKDDRRSVRWGIRAFTLIELLVVVAIIALLISILLPSLGQARGQARATLCSSRIGQLTRCHLLYADDYNETPQFIGIGYGNRMNKTYPKLDPDPTHDEAWFLNQETWLLPNMAALSVDTDWSDNVPQPRVESGTLFQYARHPGLYRCPEFERVSPGSVGQTGGAKCQDLFNYTRTLLGRKLLSNLPPPLPNDPDAGDKLYPGPIMKISAVYASSAMFMMIDEQWDYHCAAGTNNLGNILTFKPWISNGADCIFALISDTIGSYHGTLGKVIPYDFMLPSKSGCVGYYDGHAGMYADPWPWRSTVSGTESWGLLTTLVNDFNATPQGPGVKVLDPLLQSIYAQRGLSLNPLDALQFIQ